MRSSWCFSSYGAQPHPPLPSEVRIPFVLDQWRSAILLVAHESAGGPAARDTLSGDRLLVGEAEPERAVVIRAGLDYRITRNTISRIRVTTTDTAMEPRIPRRLEKNTNMATRACGPG